MASSAKDKFIDEAHEANRWNRFNNADSDSYDSDDVGLVARIDKNIKEKFQGVAIINLSDSRTNSEIVQLISGKDSKSGGDDDKKDESAMYHDLKLNNKYFTAKIQLLDLETYLGSDQAKRTIRLADCHAVVIYFDYDKFNVTALDKAKKSVDEVRGEPRILACDKYDEESQEASQQNSKIIDWCVENEYEFIPNIFQRDLSEGQDGGYDRLIDSLSAYRWPNMSMKQSANCQQQQQRSKESPKTETNVEANNNNGSDIVLNSDLMKKIEDFDDLLNKLNHFRDRPERINQDGIDRDNDELLEIAQKLSSILGDDCSGILDDDDDDDGDSSTDEQQHNGRDGAA